VARGCVDGRSRALYGFLQCLVEALAKQYGAIVYTALAMTFGALVLVVLAWMRAGFARRSHSGLSSGAL
jgi:hypothetical protein